MISRSIEKVALMKRVIILCVMALSVVIVQAQSQRSLHSLLDELSRLHRTTISFSPTLTDKVFPKNTDTRGELETALKRILTNTGYEYKIVGGKYYHVYRQPTKPPTPKKVVKETTPFVKEKKPDTTRLQTAIIRIPEIVPFHRPVMPKFDLPTPVLVPYPSSVIQTLNPQPLLAVKTNLLYDATATINLGIEIGLGYRTTLDISGNYNNWTFLDNRKMKHWLIQPELRYWTCNRFSGSFFGIHAHYARYNMGGMLPWGFKTGKMFGTVENKQIAEHRYQGWLVGAGVSYGYHWILGKRWGVEAEIGVGYAYLKYDQFPCYKCGKRISSNHENYFGPTKASISLIYIIK